MKKTYFSKALLLLAVAFIGLFFAISCEKEENKVSQSGVDEILDDDYYFYTFKNWGDTFYKQEFNKYDTCFVITLHEPNNDLLAGAKMNVGHLYTKCHIVLDRWLMVNSPTKEIDSMIAYLESTGEDFGYCNLMWRYKENGRPGEIVEAFNTRTISVKVKQGVNIDDLLHEMKVPYSHYDIDGHDSNDFFIYLNCRRDISNYYCNRITETGKVYWAQPNHTLMGNFLTNAMYSSQWNLYNTGQFGGNGGYDINVQPVWNSLNFTGMGIEVAVIDEGVDVNHPDLVNNMNLGYDATGTNYMGAMFGKSSHNDAHGTACADMLSATE
ncbi:MAG: hypothetical protein IKQ94_05460 [Bacteroidales bacterium]|nr:hypothetical protein [Bacteroidales bacterium]